MIRLTVPDLGEEELTAVDEVLKSGFLVQGERVQTFEAKVADYIGAKYAVAVTNCTAALHLALLALGIGPGDFVLVTAYSWVSTANAIIHCGARPIFVDIEPDTFNMSVTDLKLKIKEFFHAAASDNRKLKAILPVHTFGQMADMPEILRIAHDFSLKVVEDAACALGADINGKKAGAWGDIGCFSFHPRKAITTGEGGIITTSSPVVYEQLICLRNHGQVTHTGKTNFTLPGYNFRMTEIQAAIGNVQMSKLENIIALRRKYASRYDSLLAENNVHIPVQKVGSHIFQSYVVLVEKRLQYLRNTIIAEMRGKGIEVTIGTIFIPDTNYYADTLHYCPRDYPIAADVAARALTLPLHTFLSMDDQITVVECLNNTIQSLIHSNL